MSDGRPAVGIAIGDPAGVGPEIALKCALDPRVTRIARPVLFGDPRAVHAHAAACGIAAPVRAFGRADQAEWTEGVVALVALEHFRDQRLAIGAVRAAHGRAALGAARAAIDAALAGHVAAVVAAPQTELAIKRAGIEFDGYPSFVARSTGIAPEDAFLMLCFDATRIVHATLHVSLRRAIELVTRERVARVLRATHAALRKLGIATPRIAVAGLNPHAGEEGLFGNDEREVIEPAIVAARVEGIAADGPFGADTMFRRPGYDAFVVMYHDQGHIAAKLLAPNRTAGLTIGTPVLFSSVAHGSALDIAGRGRASAEAMVEAVQRLVGARATNSVEERRGVV
jgi:4-hydroxythreonine-4-phosphate dehydrogenase